MPEAPKTAINTTATFLDGEPAIDLSTDQVIASVTGTQVFVRPTYDGHGPQSIQLDADNGKVGNILARETDNAFEAVVAGEEQARSALRPDGVVATSPDGSRWLLSPDDDGDGHWARLSDPSA